MMETERNYTAEEGRPCLRGWGCSLSRLRTYIAVLVLSTVFSKGRQWLHGRKKADVLFIVSINIS